MAHQMALLPVLMIIYGFKPHVVKRRNTAHMILNHTLRKKKNTVGPPNLIFLRCFRILLFYYIPFFSFKEKSERNIEVDMQPVCLPPMIPRVATVVCGCIKLM